MIDAQELMPGALQVHHRPDLCSGLHAEADGAMRLVLDGQSPNSPTADSPQEPAGLLRHAGADMAKHRLPRFLTDPQTLGCHDRAGLYRPGRPASLVPSRASPSKEPGADSAGLIHSRLMINGVDGIAGLASPTDPLNATLRKLAQVAEDRVDLLERYRCSR